MIAVGAVSGAAEAGLEVAWRAPLAGGSAALELALAELRRGLSSSGVDLREAGEGERAELILGEDLSVRRADESEPGSTLDSPSLLAGAARVAAGRGTGRGIALAIAADRFELDWHDALRGLGERPLEIVATGAGAAARVGGLLRGLDEARRRDVRDGAELVAAIAGHRLVIGSSLEIALLALASGVPFLLAREGDAPPAALVERGLGSWTFASTDELAEKAKAMLALDLDLEPLARRDLAALDRRLAALAAAFGGSAGESAAPPVSSRPAMPPPGIRRSAGAGGDDAAARIARNLRPMIERLGGDLDRLHREVAGQRARIDELAAEVDRQSGEIARREALLRDVLESRAWRLVSAVREALASIRRALGGGGKGRVKDAR